LTVGREIEQRLHEKKPVQWEDKPATPRFGALKEQARRVKLPENGIW